MNRTQVTEFVLLSLPRGRPFLFALFLAIYLATLLGNSAILCLVCLDPHLHSPMYFFLAHLSCLDLCYSSVTVPQVLAGAQAARASVSFGGCLAQALALMWLAGAECALLALMACDRVAAVCQPLRYARLLGPRRCLAAAAGCWLWGLLDAGLHTALAARLSFCVPARLQHLFCDVPPLLAAACGDTRANRLALQVCSVFVGLAPFLLVLVSYLCILVTVLRMPLATSRRKAFSTCSAHLLVVSLFFVAANLNYNRPSSGYSPAADALVSALFCIATPMLNPLIYSLRNRQVWGALRRALRVRGTAGPPGHA